MVRKDVRVTPTVLVISAGPAMPPSASSPHHDRSRVVKRGRFVLS